MTAGMSAQVPSFSNPGRVPMLPVDASRPCGGRMKGFGLLHLLEYAHAKHGADAMRGWVESLPPPLQKYAQTAGLTSIGWLPMELYFSAVEHLVKTQHGGNARGALEIGHAMASRDIGAFFRTAMGFATPPTVFSLAGRFWRTYFDFGELAVTKKQPPTAEAELRDWPLRAEVAYHELAGSFIAWMEASKAKDVKLTRFELTSPMLLSLTIHWT